MKTNKKYQELFYIIAFSPVGVGLSGGDRIFIELAKNLHLLDVPVTVVTWEDGVAMCKRNDLDSSQVRFHIIPMHFWPKLGFVMNYFARIVYGFFWGLFSSLPRSQDPIIIYSASEFWMDTFPSFLLKLRYGKKIKLVTTWFQTAPNPFQGFAEGNRKNKYRFRAFLYWAAQLPVRFLITYFADYVLVNNEDERKRYPNLNKRNRVFVFIGAVDVDRIKTWMKKYPNIPKKYDGVFQGRFHPQKGVGELIEIWNDVVHAIPDAKLAMIGDGPLMQTVKSKIKDQKLEKNITLLGYVFDGDKKYETFASSRVVLHPALYDSGGMASAEAMAFGLPCIGFNLKAYESYYPKGMVKVPIGDTKKFAEEVVRLLKNKKDYEKVKQEATELIEKNWTWKDRARELLKFIT